ncbi:HK97 family phage prohead protease [Agrobacterium sp.]|uniref:HK97 family phage prohead protease n=1 Tax=Agrobacterium sp. TaxID=361 RepID=UPI0025C1635F|nr:HK97 family phage prohead protease [Agrobacterium sp.]MCD4660788.1 HK97 family phage prohead protease [Agrobacterium sp.]
MIIATETPVRTWIPDPDRPGDPNAKIEVDEVLLADGLDFSRVPGMPLMDNHMVERGLEATLGLVIDVRVENGQVLGTGVFAPSRRHYAADMKAGFFRQISAGFSVNQYEITEREGDVPLAVATKWGLHETSIVPVGADPNAIVTGTRGKKSRTLYPRPTYIRKRSKSRKQERTMDETQIEDLVVAAEEAIDEVTAAVEDAVDGDVEISDDLLERARGLRKFRGKRGKRGKRADEDQETYEDETRGKRKSRAEEDEEETRGKRGKRADENEDLEAELEEQLRKLRAKRKARAEDDEADSDELTPEEEADADQAVRTAKRASDELGQFARLLRANGARGHQIRKAVLRELTKSGARGASTEGLKVREDRELPTSSAATRSRYDKLNKRA